MNILAAFQQAPKSAHIGAVRSLAHIGAAHMVDDQRHRDRVQEGSKLRQDVCLEIDHDMTADGQACGNIQEKILGRVIDHTLYEQIELDQPGTMPRVRTYADPGDLAALVAAIEEVRDQADIVLISLHWGIHMVRGMLADYQRQVAHAAIDAGADAILGHHPHLMKGIEFHRGKPIFYSLGNFAIEQPHIFDPAIVRTDSFRHLVSLNPDWSLESSYMLPEETRITGITRLVVRQGAIVETRFRPCWVGDDSSPVPLSATDPRFARVQAYLAEVSAAEGLSTSFVRSGDDLILSH